VIGLRFLRSQSDIYGYYKHDDGHFLVITLYVDNMLIFGNNKDVTSDLKSQLSAQFDMKDSGVAKCILGMDIMRDGVKKKIWFG
jgi:hypothetical protein